MRYLSIAFVALAVLIGGCAGDQTKGPTYAGIGTVDQTKMEQSAFAARSAYKGILIWMDQYISMPRCGTPAATAACSLQGAVNEMRKVELAADAATAGAERIARAPTKSPSELVNAVTDANRAVEIFRSVVAIYKPQAKEAK